MSAAFPRIKPDQYQTRSLKLPYFADFSGVFMVERNKMLAHKLAAARLRKDAPSPGQLEILAMHLDMEVCELCNN